MGKYKSFEKCNGKTIKNAFIHNSDYTKSGWMGINFTDGTRLNIGIKFEEGRPTIETSYIPGACREKI